MSEAFVTRIFESDDSKSLYFKLSGKVQAIFKNKRFIKATKLSFYNSELYLCKDTSLLCKDDEALFWKKVGSIALGACIVDSSSFSSIEIKELEKISERKPINEWEEE